MLKIKQINSIVTPKSSSIRVLKASAFFYSSFLLSLWKWQNKGII
jgi:hypothetical protein